MWIRLFDNAGHGRTYLFSAEGAAFVTSANGSGFWQICLHYASGGVLVFENPSFSKDDLLEMILKAKSSGCGVVEFTAKADGSIVSHN